MLHVILATVLTWTNPAYNAPANPFGNIVGCSDNVIRCNDLVAIEIWGRSSFARADTLLGTVHTQGAGLQSTFSTNLQGPYSVWVIAVDSAGNHSCLSNHILVNAALSVPDPGHPPASGLPSVRWYDVAGRKVDTPTRHGVYFYRVGNNVTKRIYLYF